MSRLAFLFLIIFLEGYVVLSSELLAIRLMAPFTGSGADTVSIIIAAVLLPLAFGYYKGGHPSPRSKLKGKHKTVRQKLVTNLLWAALFLSFGLSYLFLDWGFDLLQNLTGIRNRLFYTSVYAILFLMIPVYLMGQTVPLISHYFPRGQLPQQAGRILFISTLGSFAGALFSTLVLMPFAGVHITTLVTLMAMVALIILLQKKVLSRPVFLALVILAIGVFYNNPAAIKRFHIVSHNQYNTVQVVDHRHSSIRSLEINRSYASLVKENSQETVLPYAAYVEDHFITPAIKENKFLKILVLGAGGFVVGRTDQINDYIYVDIDKNLKEIAENNFLEEKLSANKKFVAIDARAYLLQTEEKFDLIIVDLFRDAVSMPDSLVTTEFFAGIRDHLNPSGIMVMNFVSSPTFYDDYSRNVDATLRDVFPYLNRYPMDGTNPWKHDFDWNNIIYTYIHHDYQAPDLYTDDKSTVIYDKPVDFYPRNRVEPEEK